MKTSRQKLRTLALFTAAMLLLCALPTLTMAAGTVSIGGVSSIEIPYNAANKTESYTATCSDNPAATFTWASDNPTVATIDAAGTLTALDAGTVTITATCTDAACLASNTLTVTVTKQPTPVVTLTGASAIEIPFSDATKTETYAGSCSLHGATSITYASDAAAVAEIAATGVATAKAAGAVTFTAACTTCGQTGTKSVTVTKAAAPTVTLSGVDTIVIPALSATETATYAASCSAHGTATISYTSNAPAVAEIAATGVATAKAEGSTLLTAICTTCHQTATKSVTVTKATAPTATTTSISGTTTFTAQNQTQTYTATVIPTAAAGSFVWTVGTGYEIVGANNQPTVTVKALTATNATAPLAVTFTPTDATAYSTSNASATLVTTISTEPSLVLSATQTNFSNINIKATVTATIQNPGSTPWTLTADLPADGVVAVIGSGFVGNELFLTSAGSGSTLLTVTATNGTRTLTGTLVFTVTMPSLTLTAEHSTLSVLPHATILNLVQDNPGGGLKSNDKLTWSIEGSEDSKGHSVADNKVIKLRSANSKLSDNKARAEIEARGNGTAYVRVRTAEGKLTTRVKITVKDYKAIPQTGQDMRAIYMELAVLAAVLVAAGVIYVKKRKQARQ